LRERESRNFKFEEIALLFKNLSIFHENSSCLFHEFVICLNLEPIASVIPKLLHGSDPKYMSLSRGTDLTLNSCQSQASPSPIWKYEFIVLSSVPSFIELPN
jgi:hypothetical protein